MNDQRRSGIFLPFWSSCAPRGNLTFKLEKYRSSAPLSMQSVYISDELWTEPRAVPSFPGLVPQFFSIQAQILSTYCIVIRGLSLDKAGRISRTALGPQLCRLPPCRCRSRVPGARESSFRLPSRGATPVHPTAGFRREIHSRGGRYIFDASRSSGSTHPALLFSPSRQHSCGTRTTQTPLLRWWSYKMDQPRRTIQLAAGLCLGTSSPGFPNPAPQLTPD